MRNLTREHISMNARFLSAVAISILAIGCGKKECDFDDPASCDEGYVCEAVTEREKPLCFRPIELQGRVFDLAEPDGGIAEARITPTDENGAVVGPVVQSDTTGGFVLQVSVARSNDDGDFAARKILLRAEASGYYPLPSGVRRQVPVELATATKPSQDEAMVITEGAEIGLAALPAADQGQASIEGTVELPPGASALVIAETAAGAVSRNSIAAGTGAFRIVNVPDGAYSLRAYTKGVNYTPVDVTVASSTTETGVEILQSDVAAAEVNGSITIVAGSGETSVILAVKSTFNETLGRGEAPAGLRAPDPGIAPNIGAGQNFTITGVPDGDYVVLAGFENDGMVRDPDTGIAGTDLRYLTVANGAVTTTEALDFKVTGAIVTVSPGAESVEETTATPTFTWGHYPSTATYNLEVLNAQGAIVWSTSVGGTGGGNQSLVYAGDPLTPGATYQWRVESIGTGGTTKSRTEDLRGVFRVAPAE
jgi:hypothetical protein